MSKIIEFLRDPSWWFSAFFVAIISSVLAAFLKDLFNEVLSLFSSRYRKWNRKRIANNKRYIKKIAKDSTLLIISFIRGLIYSTIFSLTVVMYALTPLFGDLIVRSPEAIYSFFAPDIILYTMRLCSMGFAVLAMSSGYISVNEFMLSNEAYKIYKNNSLNQEGKE